MLLIKLCSLSSVRVNQNNTKQVSFFIPARGTSTGTTARWYLVPYQQQQVLIIIITTTTTAAGMVLPPPPVPYQQYLDCTYDGHTMYILVLLAMIMFT